MRRRSIDSVTQRANGVSSTALRYIQLPHCHAQPLQLSHDQWRQLQDMQAGQHEALESPRVSSQDLPDDGPEVDHEDFGAVAVAGLTPLARSGASISTSSARKAQAFLAQRQAVFNRHKPTLDTGSLLNLEEWVTRNSHAAGDTSLNHTINERAFATSTLRAAMGVDSAMLHGATARVPTKVVSKEREFLMAKTLRGATCDPPVPDEQLAARAAHKTALYTQPLTVRDPKPILLTPRQVEEKGYPPLLQQPYATTGQLDDYRYGSAPDEVTHAAINAERQRQAARQGSVSTAKDHFAAQARMRGGGGGAPGPVPSPMLLPSPSAPILAASLAAPNSFVAPNLSTVLDD